MGAFSSMATTFTNSRASWGTGKHCRTSVASCNGLKICSHKGVKGGQVQSQG